MMSGTGQKATEKSVTQRYEALLRVSQRLISVRSSEELFSILARELRAVVSFYVMGVGIYDERAHEVRLTSYGEPGDPLEVPKFAPEETFTTFITLLLVPVFYSIFGLDLKWIRWEVAAREDSRLLTNF